MRKELTAILNGALADLVGELGNLDELFRLLLKHKVLSDEQIEGCKVEKTSHKKVEALIDKLKRVQDKYYRTFCDILKELDREDLVKKYLQPGLSLLEGEGTSEQTRTETDSVVDVAGAHYSATQQGPDDVFISYTWAIHETVEKLYNKLTAEGIRCWKDDKRMRPGDKLSKEIDRAIRDCPVFLACITKEYTQSKYCMSEIDLAFGLPKKIIPLRLDNMEWPPEAIGLIAGSLLYIDFCPAAAEGGQINWDLAKIGRLIDAIKGP